MAAPETAVRTCAKCGSDDLVWGDEFRGWGCTPDTTGYEVEFCNECEEPTGERNWVGH